MLKIVAIDDNPITLQSLETTIDWEKLGCVLIGTADNAERALEIINYSHVDIIISDIKMPGMSGLEFAETICKMGMHTKVILITGFHEFELVKSAIKIGVFDFLTKPFSNDEIFSAVQKAVIAIKKERQENPRLMPDRQNDEVSPMVRRAIEYLEKSFKEPITLEDVSKNLNANSSYLSRAIKKEMGRGFIEILTEMRLEHAKKLLENPNMKIYEVAKQVSYNDYTYFFQVFKKRYGISPNEYRKRFLI